MHRHEQGGRSGAAAGESSLAAVVAEQRKMLFLVQVPCSMGGMKEDGESEYG